MDQPHQPHQPDRAVGVQLQNLRIFKGYSREEAARQLDITSNHLEAVEGGAVRPEPALLLKLANIYGVPVSQVFTVAAAALPSSF